jgi:hypothetical protein
MSRRWSGPPARRPYARASPPGARSPPSPYRSVARRDSVPMHAADWSAIRAGHDSPILSCWTRTRPGCDSSPYRWSGWYNTDMGATTSPSGSQACRRRGSPRASWTCDSRSAIGFEAASRASPGRWPILYGSIGSLDDAGFFGGSSAAGNLVKPGHAAGYLRLRRKCRLERGSQSRHCRFFFSFCWEQEA